MVFVCELQHDFRALLDPLAISFTTDLGTLGHRGFTLSRQCCFQAER